MVTLYWSVASTVPPRVRVSTWATGVRELVAVTDWSKPEIVNVMITEYDFQPSRLVFEAGKTYRLNIINRGAFKHTFSSSGFFNSIAVRRLEAAEGTSHLPNVVRLVFEPDEEKELLFLAVKTGEHLLECLHPLHFALGPWAANGTIKVQSSERGSPL